MAGGKSGGYKSGKVWQNRKIQEEIAKLFQSPKPKRGIQYPSVASLMKKK